MQVEINIHIGKEIKNELDRQGRKTAWLAAQLSCDVSNVYKIFRRATIDTELLRRISDVMNFDFFKLYSAQLKNGHIGK